MQHRLITLNPRTSVRYETNSHGWSDGPESYASIEVGAQSSTGQSQRISNP